MFLSRQVIAHQFNLVTKLGGGGPHVDHRLVVIAHVLRSPVRSPRDFRPRPRPVLRWNALHSPPTRAPCRASQPGMDGTTCPSALPLTRAASGLRTLGLPPLSCLTLSTDLKHYIFPSCTDPQRERANYVCSAFTALPHSQTSNLARFLQTRFAHVCSQFDWLQPGTATSQPALRLDDPKLR